MMVMGLACRLVTFGLLPLLAGPEPAAEDWQHLGLAGTYTFNDTTQDYACGRPRVRIHAYNDDVVRVTLAPLGQYIPGDSWALVDDQVRGSFLSTDPAMATLVSETWSLKLIAHRRDCRLEFRDLQDRPIFREDEERGMSWLGSVKRSGGRKAGGWRARPVRDWIHLPEGAAVYGLGDYRGPFNRRGRVYRLWNSGLSAGQGDSGAGAQSIPL